MMASRCVGRLVNRERRGPVSSASPTLGTTLTAIVAGAECDWCPPAGRTGMHVTTWVLQMGVRHNLADRICRSAEQHRACHMQLHLLAGDV